MSSDSNTLKRYESYFESAGEQESKLTLIIEKIKKKEKDTVDAEQVMEIEYFLKEKDPNFTIMKFYEFLNISLGDYIAVKAALHMIQWDKDQGQEKIHKVIQEMLINGEPDASKKCSKKRLFRKKQEKK